MIRQQGLIAPNVTSTSESTTTLPRWISNALIGGGASWMVYYGSWIVSGVTTGAEPAMGTALFIIASLLFCFALLGLNGGIFGLGLQIRSQAPILGTIALAISAFGIASALYAIFGHVLFGLKLGNPGGFGVLSMCLSATMAGIGAWRSKALPKRLAVLLLGIGVLTFPLIILFVLAVPGLPSWASDELPFMASGLTWVIFASLLKRS